MGGTLANIRMTIVAWFNRWIGFWAKSLQYLATIKKKIKKKKSKIQKRVKGNEEENYEEIEENDGEEVDRRENVQKKWNPAWTARPVNILRR